MGTSLSTADIGGLSGSKSARILATIRRDIDLKTNLMRGRLRNEEVLSLAYRDGEMTQTVGGGGDTLNLRTNALNLPYRYVRWIEAQAVGKRLVVKVDRDAGEGQRPGGPGDNVTGKWVGITLGRAAYEAGFDRETRALIAEVIPRGTSVLRIGYHQEAITYAQSTEVGKDAQSVVADVLGKGDVEAKDGQAHAEISEGLLTMASDPMTQMAMGQEGVEAVLERKASHDAAEYEAETEDTPTESVREIRHRVWMRKLRVGEECGWTPHVYDVADAGMWWARHVNTVAEVKRMEIFAPWFRAKCGDYAMDARNASGVARGGRTESTNSMGSDARQAQSEDVLDDDEKMVEWFEVWVKRPEMKSGGVRYIVCAGCPEKFVQSDETNPHTHAVGPMKGYGMIPGFFPFYDFTPILSSLTIPERTCGVPPIAVGMTQFEQIAVLYRLLVESAKRHSLRLYQKHPGLKDNKEINDALYEGRDGYAFDAPSQCLNASTGQMEQAVIPIQFSGNTLDIERLLARLESDWIKMMGMPPAVLQGVGTAGTAAQDNMGLAAGEAESGALIGYFERRMGDVFSGLRGLIRGNYDDEDFIRILGEEGAEVMKAWQSGSTDDGDVIHVTFGSNEQAEKAVTAKQIMEMIGVEKAEIDPVTGMEKYDHTGLIDELHRLFDIGAPVKNSEQQDELVRLAMIGKQVLEAQAAAQGAQPGKTGQPGGPTGGEPSEKSTGATAPKPPPSGPNPAEGDGPTGSALASGAHRM